MVRLIFKTLFLSQENEKNRKFFIKNVYFLPKNETKAKNLYFVSRK